ncbi:hypothetical protein CS528_02440 [Mesoplasma entomophilum]|uniref:Uncharacterized protein n=2 Tax=Mesoplasma entomophilum TaxID=2149 RepID=A0A3S5XZX8_9MOLU|nr:hypothetical protein CS528_02440 [Mesoplasma entomophilum]
MINKDYLEEFETELKENSDAEFIASFSALKRYQKKDYLKELTYLGSEVKNFYFYPLTTLTGRELTEGIRIAKEKTTIMCTTPDKVIKIQLFMEKEDSTYELNEFTDPANFSEQLIKNSKRISGVFDFNADLLKLSDKEIEDWEDEQIEEYASALEKEMKLFDINKLYLITEEKLTDENFDSVPKYLNQRLTYNSTEDEYDIDFVPIDEFTSLYDAQPLIIVNSEPIKGKIKGLGVKTPLGTLVGNIKPVNEEGHFPDLVADKDTHVFKKLTFPFQTTPTLNLIDYWSSDQIIPLKDIFSYLDDLGVNYDEEFSLAKFISFSKEDPSLKTISIEGIQKLEAEKKVSGNNFTVYSAINPEDPEWETCTMQESRYTRSSKIEISELSKTSNNLRLTCKWYPQSNSFVDHRKHVWNVTEYRNENSYKVNYNSPGAQDIDTAVKVVLQMLTESFWKDYEFKGATKIEINGGQSVETIADKDIYLLNQKYSGQDRYSVTTNNWLAWKSINRKIVNANPNLIKRIEGIFAMLSGTLKSNFSINKGDNDDYKILLPYYFEMTYQIDNPSKYVSYEDIKVRLKSNYFNFTKDGIEPKNKNISNNEIYKLDYNHYAFPELTKTTESASIPSSIPSDQELANGEFSKYQMKCFTNNKDNFKIMIDQYGSGNIYFNPLTNKYIENEGKFYFNDPQNIQEIIISSFFGMGTWSIEFIADNIINLKLNLFDKYSSYNNFRDIII